VVAKEVAQIGAAIGREFSYDLLASAAHRSDSELRAALDRLIGAGLVFRRGEPPDVSFLFKHALVQDAAYGTLLRGPRGELHARIAGVLEERLATAAEVQPEILAHHCANAGLTEKAVLYWQEAGERSKARSAMAEAIRQMRKALDLLSHLPDTPGRQRTEVGLQLALGGALIAAKGHAAEETGKAYARASSCITMCAPKLADRIASPKNCSIWPDNRTIRPPWSPVIGRLGTVGSIAENWARRARILSRGSLFMTRRNIGL